VFVAMAAGHQEGRSHYGAAMSVFDIAPTILHIYGTPVPTRMRASTDGDLKTLRAQM